MQHYTVAVVGLGYFSQFHLDSWQRIERTQLAAVVARNRAKADVVASQRQVAAYASLEELVAGMVPDILDIVTPPETHAAFIREAIQAGCRTIICQKPFCLDFREAARIAAEAEQAGVLLVVHENFRFQPWHRAIKREVEAGRLGSVYQCRFDLRPGDGRGADAYLERQPAFRGMQRFLVHETGVHFFDLFRWLFGEVGSVFADLRQLNPAIAGEDSGILLLHHANGIRSIFDGNRLADHSAENRRKTMGEMKIEGEKGCLRLDGEGRLWFRRFGSNAEEALPIGPEMPGFGGGCVEALNRHVVDHVEKGAPIENTAAQYLPVVALDEAAYRSARSRQVVDIDYERLLETLA